MMYKFVIPAKINNNMTHFKTGEGPFQNGRGRFEMSKLGK